MNVFDDVTLNGWAYCIQNEVQQLEIDREKPIYTNLKMKRRKTFNRKKLAELKKEYLKAHKKDWLNTRKVRFSMRRNTLKVKYIN